ncbi:MAG: hypothetical protein H0U74_09605 [Bradymonadaceae bacterium]|nr:hypothetical protein [Lujinxingiaceae bacterium]
MRLDPAFAPLLQGFDLEVLNKSTATIYGIWSDTRLAYYNDAWERFAHINHPGVDLATRWPLGRPIREAFGPLEAFYDDAFAHVLDDKVVWHHDFQCNSAQRFRMYHMAVYPLQAPGAERGLLLINSLTVDHPHPDTPTLPDPLAEHYRNAKGLITMCSHCRRTRQGDDDTHWDWVPNFVEHPPDDLSHGLCNICLDFYYPRP